MKRMFSRVEEWIRNLKIQNKLLLAFLGLSFFPMLLIAGTNFAASKSILEEKTSRYSHDILMQATVNIESKLDKIEDISFSILFDTELQNLLQKAAANSLDAYEQSRIQTGVESVLASQILYHDEIDAAFVVTAGNSIYQMDKTKQNYGVLEQRRDEILEAGGSARWFNCGSDEVVALARAINSVVTQKTLGYLVMYIDTDFFLDTLSDVQSTMGGALWLVDGEYQVLLGRKNRPDIPTVDLTQAFERESYSFSRDKTDGRQQYRAIGEEMANNWKIVAAIPVSDYQREIANLRNTTFFVTVILFFFTVFFAWSISRSISKPIHDLTLAMTRFGNGELNVRCKASTNDEVGLCAETFSRMAENIGQLIQKVYEEQLMKREAELKTLRMQINPHFLYNTLDTINWMARANGSKDICVMVKSLGDLMRAAINGGDFVSIREEIKNLKNYLTIQEYRYKDKFQTFFEIEANTEEVFIPKMILQPLVENAIYHGIEPLFEQGYIRISTAIKDQLLQIDVCDNGAGMSEETVQQLMNGKETPSTGKESIGIQNVIKRIKKLYGEEYGLIITSDYGEGTTVRIEIPAAHKIDTDNA